MRAHPAFIRALDALIPTYSVPPAVKAWREAGCPVVQEPEPHPCFPFFLRSGSAINLTGTINLDAYPELRRAIVEAAEREAELAAAKARIAELEADPRLHGLWSPAKSIADIRNEALEDAANFVAREGFKMGTAAIYEGIRALKRGA